VTQYWNSLQLCVTANSGVVVNSSVADVQFSKGCHKFEFKFGCWES